MRQKILWYGAFVILLFGIIFLAILDAPNLKIFQPRETKPSSSIITAFTRARHNSIFKRDYIYLGAIISLSGRDARSGKACKQGMDLAVQSINASGGIKGKYIQMIYGDSQSSIANAKTLFNTLVTQYAPAACIGDISSSLTQALTPLAQEKAIVLLAPLATNSELTTAGSYIYRISNSDAEEAVAAAHFAAEILRLKTMAVIYLNNVYGASVESAFSANFNKSGRKVLFSQKYTGVKAGAAAIVRGLSKLNPEGILLICNSSKLADMLQDCQALFPGRKIIGSSAFGDAENLKIINSSPVWGQEIFFPAPLLPDENYEPSKVFFDIFKERYHAAPAPEAFAGYDCVNVIAQALNKVYENPSLDLRGALDNLELYKGATGPIKFDSYGDVHKPFGFKSLYRGSLKWFYRPGLKPAGVESRGAVATPKR